jgi:hypothetical protein
MKRTSPLRSQGIRSSDPFNNLSLEQLAYIGAIAMLYNDLEDIIDEMCGHCLVGTIQPSEITSRINGVEGKIEIIKHAAKQWGFDGAELATLGETFGQTGFSELKSLRDAVVHGRVFDLSTSVARTRAKKGKVGEVLFHIDALKGLFARMEEMRVELRFIEDILALKHRAMKGDLDDRRKERLGEETQAYWSQVQLHRTQRQSLPPMPEWPEDKINLERAHEALRKENQRGKR